MLGAIYQMYFGTFRMHYFKPLDAPIKKVLALNLDQGPKTNQDKEKMWDVPYASAIRSLMYVMLCTQPNICFVVGLASHY